MAGKPVRISILANGRQAKAELRGVASEAGLVGKQLSKVAKIATGVFAVSQLTRGAAAFIKLGSTYTSQLQKIQALTTAQQRAQVGGMSGVAKALEANRGLYAKYGSTVGDAAAGVTELVKAGQSLPDSLREINATMVLAKAGEMSVADASSVVATALTNFHLKAQQAGDVANYLANAANISTADVSDLAEALKFVAPVAAQSGISIQKTSAYLAELSNAGINGTLAGTGLRKVLQSLQAPAGVGAKAIKNLGLEVYNAQGKARPFQDVMADLGKALDKVSEAKRKQALRQIFGLTGVTAATVLLKNGTKGLNDYTKGVERAGAAAKLAASNSKGLTGTLSRLKALGESSGQALYRNFSPLVDKALKPVADWLENNQDQIAGWGKSALRTVAPALESVARLAKDTITALKDFSSPLQSVLRLVGPLADGVKTLADAADKLPGPLKAIVAESILMYPLLGKVQAGVGAMTGAFSAGVTRVAAFRTELSLIGTDRAWQSGLNQLSAAGIVNTANLNMTTRASSTLRTSLSKLGPAAKAAAGVGGMLVLTDAMGQATSKGHTLRTALEGTLGGAAIGTSIMPGIGTLIGAAGGLGLAGLAAAFGKSSRAAEAQKAAFERTQAAIEAKKDEVDRLKDSLDQVSGAFTNATRQSLYNDIINNKLTKHGQQSLNYLNQYGVSLKQVTDAMMGNPAATQAVTAAQQRMIATVNQNAATITTLQGNLADLEHTQKVFNQQGVEAPASIRAQIAATKQHIGALRSQNAALGEATQLFGTYGHAARDSRTQWIAQTLATRGYIGSLKGLPKSVRTQIKTVGLSGTLTEVQVLARQFKLTPKQIKVLLKAEGIAATRKNVQAVRKDIQNVSDTKPDMSKVVDGVKQGIDKMKGIAKSGSKQTGAAITGGTANSVASSKQKVTSAAKSMASSAIGGAKGIAASESGGIGSAITAGAAGGVYSTASNVASAAAYMVRNALNAARQEALIRSPSKKTKQYGKWFAQGFELGIKGYTKRAAKAAQKLSGEALKKFRQGVTKGRGIRTNFYKDFTGSKADASKVLSDITSFLGSLEGAQKKAVRRIAHQYTAIGVSAKSLSPALRGYFTGAELKGGKITLNELAKAQTRVNNQLDAAKQKLSSLKQSAADLKSSITDTFNSFADVTQLGVNADTGAVSRTGLVSGMQDAVAQAQQFQKVMQQLQKKGLNKTQLQQLWTAGPSALQSALALNDRATVRTVNALQAQLDKASKSLGNSAADKMYSAGIRAAQGLVQGLTKDQKALQKAAERIANAIVNRIKKKLGIHSPSRVFADLGTQMLAGLQIGLDETTARKAGSQVAAGVVKGFGTPALDAYVAAGSGGSKQTIQIQLTAQQVDQLTRGKQIIADIDAAKAAGARSKT